MWRGTSPRRSPDASSTRWGGRRSGRSENEPDDLSAAGLGEDAPLTGQTVYDDQASAVDGLGIAVGDLRHAAAVVGHLHVDPSRVYGEAQPYGAAPAVHDGVGDQLADHERAVVGRPVAEVLAHHTAGRA